jgi:hypothetical protein
METALLEELLRSKSFLNWSPEPKSKSAKPPTISLGRGRSFTYSGKRYTNLAVDEKHFAPADLAKAWVCQRKKSVNFFVRSRVFCASVQMATVEIADT